MYLLNEETALIQTVDFFTPMVDDPFVFGQIAAANALSDVYAMGGQPLLCMNILCCPTDSMDASILRQVLAGGLDKIKEAGALLVGGHSVEDPELKYGLAVTGTVMPQHLLSNAGARPGDVLLLTKPLGSGILATALKGGLLSGGAEKAMVEAMIGLNRMPVELLAHERFTALRSEVHACTDITGFGLFGHGYEMAAASGVSLHLEAARLPLLPESLEMASMGMIPASAYRNQEHYRAFLHSSLPEDALEELVAFDPQSSGGLLFSLNQTAADAMLAGLQELGYKFFAHIIGRVAEGPAGTIYFS